MAELQVVYRQSTRQARVQNKGAAVPTNFTKIGEFTLDEPDNPGASDENFVYFHFVRDLLYPMGQWNMQEVEITRH